MEHSIIEVKIRPEDIDNEDILRETIRKAIGGQIFTSYRLLRKSIDARQKNVYYRLRIEVFLKSYPTKHLSITYPNVASRKSVIIIGAGPAGYFAALKLIELGIKPIVLERGKDVQTRRRDLRAIQQKGVVNPHSNYCFGEGGAGTYSDGKLYTRSHKRGRIQEILEILHDHGAKDSILYDAHPHIGSNKLPQIVTAIRETIELNGGQVIFDAFVNDFEINNGKIEFVRTESGEIYRGSSYILATGHSARDIYELLAKKKLHIESKDYALGVRIEHPQSMIDRAQYHRKERGVHLPAASYRLACEVDDKGVFSFCMCPGGLIVPAATAPGELVVNGMSLSRRDSPFANSGFVTAVNASDFDEFKEAGIFAGLKYQQHYEQVFFNHGDGSQKAPAQKVVDFLEQKESTLLNETSYIPGIYSAPLHLLLPLPVVHRLQEGLKRFSKRIAGYISEEAQLIGIESRTSSPIRIPRDRQTYTHPDISNLYPCGEGAGYAGGILSAAMDGQNVAKKISKVLNEF